MSARDRLEMSLDELKATRTASEAGGGGGDSGGGKGRRKGKGKGKGGGRVRNNGRESRRPQEYFDGECNICGETGHRARDCPEGGGNLPRAAFDGECNNCGQTGHRARDCPEGGGKGGVRGSRKGIDADRWERSGDDSGGRGGRGGGGRGGAFNGACNLCGETGHRARDCPVGGGEQSSGGEKSNNGRKPQPTAADLDDDMDNYFNGKATEEKEEVAEPAKAAKGTGKAKKVEVSAADLDDDMDSYFQKKDEAVAE